jgi:hypothetical protein
VCLRVLVRAPVLVVDGRGVLAMGLFLCVTVAAVFLCCWPGEWLASLVGSSRRGSLCGLCPRFPFFGGARGVGEVGSVCRTRREMQSCFS